MPTAYQLYRNNRVAQRRRSRAPLMRGCPQLRGTCRAVQTMSPKKPNSANRRVAKIFIVRLRRRKMTAFIPGIGHNLQRHSNVMVRGGRVPDLPGVKYKLIRGKLDLPGVAWRRKARSKYGVRIHFND